MNQITNALNRVATAIETGLQSLPGIGGLFGSRGVERATAPDSSRSQAISHEGSSTGQIAIRNRTVSSESLGESARSALGTTLPADEDEAVQDATNRSTELTNRRLSEGGGPLAQHADAEARLCKLLHTLKSDNLVDAGERLEMAAFCDEVAADAEQRADALRDEGGALASGLADSFDNIAAELRQLADESRLSTADIPPRPRLVCDIMHAKSHATQGAITVLENALKEARGKEQMPGALAAMQSAIDFLKDRQAAFTSATDTTSLSTEQAQALMGSKSGAKALDDIDAKIRKPVAQALEAFTITRGAEGLSLPDVFLKKGAATADEIRNAGDDVGKWGLREDHVMEMFLDKVFSTTHIEGPADLKGALNDARLGSINDQTWNAITKRVAYQHGDRIAIIEDHCKPQSQLGNVFDAMGGHGVNCHMAMSYEHVTNLNVTSASVDGEQVFEGTRHGTLAAYHIDVKHLKKLSTDELTTLIQELKFPTADPNDAHDTGTPVGQEIGEMIAKLRGDKKKEGGKIANELRQIASDRRAIDVGTAALIKNDAKLAEALANHHDDANSPVHVTLSINSISLLTPGKFPSGERKMWDNQAKAWENLQRRPQTIEVKDANGQTVRVNVKFEVKAFNFGVNQMALGGAGKEVSGFNPKKHLKEAVMPLTGMWPVRFFTGNWGHVGAQNRAAMEALLGAKGERNVRDAAGGPPQFQGTVGTWLRSNPTHPDAPHVRTLATQITELFDGSNRSYQHAGNDPHKIVSRLAVLTYMIGEDPAWNCKSGKDRTGQLDVEAKYLATYIKLNNEVPAYDRPRSDTERKNMLALGVGGINFDVQQQNTSLPGFKLGNFPTLASIYSAGSKSTEWNDLLDGSAFHGS